MDTGSRKADEPKSAEKGQLFPFAGGAITCQFPSVVKTLFQKIHDNEIPADVIYRDDLCFAFRDISPQAPTHVLIVPVKPIPRVGEATAEDQAILGHLLLTAAKIAVKLGISETGYRITINNGEHGGETVPHLHVHLLGGRQLIWPPG
jgi:histidine triad (HIT) family protein